MFIQFPFVGLSWHLLVVVVLAVVVKILCQCVWFRNRPSFMHLLWVLVMLKLITPTMVGLPIYERAATNNWFQSADSKTLVEPANNFRSISNNSNATRGHQATAEHPLANVTGHATPSLRSFGHTPTTLATLPLAVLIPNLLLALWSSVAIAFILRLLKQIIGVHRLQRCLATDPMLQSMAECIGHRIGCRRIPSIRVINVAMSPSLTGCFRPTILVPKRLCDDFSREQMEAVLAHELSHYRRGDHITALAGLAIRAVCWWNPIAWWAYHELRCSQELCCDAMAIGRARVPTVTYAQSLWTVVKWLDRETVVHVRPSAAMVSDAPSRHFRERLLSITRSQSTFELNFLEWLFVFIIGIGLVCHPSYGALRFSPNAFQYRFSEAIPPKFHDIANEWTDAPPDSTVLGPQLDRRIVARGQFWFGRMDKPILLAILESKSDKAPILWVDSNRDQRLEESEFAKPMNDTSSWRFRITSFSDATNSGKAANRHPTFQTLHASTECQIQVRYHDHKFSIAQAGQLHGSFSLNGSTIAAAVEDRNCNGLWTDREDRLYVDVDGDGKWNAFEERFSCQELPNIRGTRYTLAFKSDELDLVALEGTGQLQAELHLLDPDAIIESCQAVLASTAGVHITVDSLEHSVEVPVGEYLVKQVRLRLRDERVWSMVFEANGSGTARVKVAKGMSATIDLLGEIKLGAEIIGGSLQLHHQAPVIVQPMCTSETGLYLVRCAVGNTAADEDSLLTGTIMMADGSARRIDGIETTGFACGTFCPIRFPKSDLTGGLAFITMHFDAGPLAGMITATLDGKP